MYNKDDHNSAGNKVMHLGKIHDRRTATLGKGYPHQNVDQQCRDRGPDFVALEKVQHNFQRLIPNIRLLTSRCVEISLLDTVGLQVSPYFLDNLNYISLFESRIKNILYLCFKTWNIYRRHITPSVLSYVYLIVLRWLSFLIPRKANLILNISECLKHLSEPSIRFYWKL